MLCSSLHPACLTLLALHSAGGDSEQTFKAVTLHMFTMIILYPPFFFFLLSFTPILARGTNFISASISGVINKTRKQFRGKVTLLTSLPS